MIEGIRKNIGHHIGSFQRNWLNRGYVEYLLREQQTREQNLDQQVTSLIGKLAITATPDTKRIEDEAFVLRDQIFELELGRIALEVGEKAVVSGSDKLR